MFNSSSLPDSDSGWLCEVFLSSVRPCSLTSFTTDICKLSPDFQRLRSFQPLTTAAGVQLGVWVKWASFVVSAPPVCNLTHKLPSALELPPQPLPSPRSDMCTNTQLNACDACFLVVVLRGGKRWRGGRADVKIDSKLI